MKSNNRALRTGVLVVLGLVFVRLLLVDSLGDKISLFSRPQIASFLIEGEAGKLPQNQEQLQSGQPTAPTSSGEVPVTVPIPTDPVSDPTDPVSEPTDPTDPTEPVTMPKPAQTSHTFAAGDEALIKLNDIANAKPDLAALLAQPLPWDLTSEEPSVLILHTHGTEAYTPTEDSNYKEEGGKFRTTNSDYNVISIGAELARLLEEAGIHVVHDMSFYDYPDYEAAYDNSRTGLQGLLKKHPSVQLVIDLHRDSSENEDGSQWASDVLINGERSAQLMMVMGTDTYYTHSQWQENLSVALKLNALMEKTHPGCTRELSLRRQRFNQDLFPASMIVEVGTAGNTHREAINAVTVLAEAIILMAKGANT